MSPKSTKSLVVLMIEHEQPEGLSARKLVVESAKHNVLTAYNVEDGVKLLERFPKVDAVLVHGLLQNRDDLIGEVRKRRPEMPVIVASPVERDYPGANFTIPSHEPSKLLDLLAREFGASITN